MKSYKSKQNSLEKVAAIVLKNAGVSKILATVSGGADSVALLAALSSNPRLSVIAAHCNFHLRGEESMRDQLFVENLCRRLNITLIVKDFDVEHYRNSRSGVFIDRSVPEAGHKVSIEMACRELRYEWFRSLLEEYGLERIATGHNADDNIETLLLNLLRGSGTTGLRGMLPDSNGVIRPLLSIHRTEILSYLKEKDLDYVTDSSNLQSDFRRNFLRNEILPLLRSRWPGADKALDRSIELLRAENAVVEAAVSSHLPASEHSQSQKPLKDNVTSQSKNSLGNCGPLKISEVLSFPAPELLIRRYILPLSPRTTTATEIFSAIKAEKSDVRRWQLPGGIVELRAGRIRLIPSDYTNQQT